MQSFGYANVGSILIRRDDRAPFVVVELMGDRLYVQRTLRVRNFATWYRAVSGGRLAVVEYPGITIGEKLVCTVHQGPRFVVLAKDDQTHEVIVAEGIITNDPSCWDLARPQ